MTSSSPPVPSVAPLDVQVLQTAAALENLAVMAYAAAADQRCMAAASARLRALIARNKEHHTDHALSFNQALISSGTAPQFQADARYALTVRRRMAAMTDPGSVADLLMELEDINAQSCSRFATLLQGRSLRGQLVNVASVEAQHHSELLILRALPDGDQASQAVTSSAPHPAVTLTVTAGTIGIPYGAYPTTDASAINEGRPR